MKRWSPRRNLGAVAFRAAGMCVWWWVSVKKCSVTVGPQLRVSGQWKCSYHLPSLRHFDGLFLVDGCCVEGEATTRLWVLGGRARRVEDYPEGWERVHGGFYPPRSETWRDSTALMNDV